MCENIRAAAIFREFSLLRCIRILFRLNSANEVALDLTQMIDKSKAPITAMYYIQCKLLRGYTLRLWKLIFSHKAKHK